MARIEIESEVAGTVWQIPATVGAQVAEGEAVVILESMKMEVPVEAPVSGTLLELFVGPEEAVEEGQAVAVLEAD